MVGARVFIAVALLSTVHGDWSEILDENVDQATPVQSKNQRRFIFSLMQNTIKQRPLSNGINSMTEILTNGMRKQQEIITGGLNTAREQMSNITSEIQRTAASAMAKGSQMMVTAIEMVTLPSVQMAAGLSIMKLNRFLRLTGQDVQSLPAISHSMWGFGTLRTSEGRLSRLSSLAADGPVSVNVTGRAFRVAIPLRLEELRVFYSNYSFSTWGMDLSGNISVAVRDNALVAHVQVLTSIGCLLNVERVETVRFGDIDVQVTGLCSFCSSVVTFLANYMQETLQAEVQKAIDDGLRNLLAEDPFLCANPTPISPI